MKAYVIAATVVGLALFVFTAARAAATSQDAASPQSQQQGFRQLQDSPQSQDSSSPSAEARLVWRADFEDGGFGAWEEGGGGGVFNSGNGDAVVTSELAHGGSRAAKLTISATGSDTGARLHRWSEAEAYDKAYYSAWYYFPQRYDVLAGWWNVFQFKSRTEEKNDPFWILYVGNRRDGTMYLYLRNWITKRSYQQQVADIPVGRWFKVEVYLDQSDDGTGEIRVWQDGVELFHLTEITTGYPGGRTRWGVTNYSSNITPRPTTIYVDDAEIRVP